jgi:hypothetical protein
MKSTTILAIALGLGSLAACNNSAQEQNADNIEANADNSADAMQANAENTADAVRNEGEQKADSVRNSADADGNSSN